MVRRIAMWASGGFLVACCWIVYTFVTPPETLVVTLREPLVQALALASCPICYAGRYFPLHFWWIPPINAATYVLIGVILEALRGSMTRQLAV
jgi:hypothetical protein